MLYCKSNLIMDKFLNIPQALYTRCIQQGKLTHMGQHSLCYEADIRAICLACQTHQLQRPDYLMQAGQQRLDEFFAGRIAAEAILLEYFNCRQSITSMTTTLPIWPQAFKGSISHANNTLMVMLSTQAEYLGVDIEYMVSADIAEQTAGLILTRSEQDLYWSGSIKTLSFAEYFTLIFSLKESLYKAVYPCAKNYIDFLQAELISIDMLQHTACFKFSPEIMQSYPLLQHYHTHWDQRPDHFVTYCVPV